MSPTGFPDEATRHTLVERDPYLLPLADSPRIAVVGREVRLGSGYADLLAVEEEGCLVVIEIKLARNAEARRAVVAQVLAYASELQRLTPETLEADALSAELKKRGHTSLFDAAKKLDQTGSIDEEAFRTNLTASLAQGRIRLVLVLDAAPPELVRIASYLRLVAEGRVLLDLITLASYSVGGTELLVPQRVDAEAPSEDSETRACKSVKKGGGSPRAPPGSSRRSRRRQRRSRRASDSCSTGRVRSRARTWSRSRAIVGSPTGGSSCLVSLPRARGSSASGVPSYANLGGGHRVESSAA